MSSCFAANERKAQTQMTPASTPVRAALQRKCACGGPSTDGGECDHCKQEKLQRKKSESTGPATAPHVVHEVLETSGQALDTSAREFFEPRFGHDFSKVRVHTGDKAAESARAVNAHAYTVANNVVFGAGKYAPRTSEGRELIAHELAHTIQQQNATVAPQALEISEPDERAEIDADRVAQASLSGGSTSKQLSSGTRVSRQQAHAETEEEKKKREREEAIKSLLNTNPRGPSAEGPEEKAEKERKEAEKKSQEKKKQELLERAKSEPYGREQSGAQSTWGWGAPETNNLKQECKSVGMDRPDFLSFQSIAPPQAGAIGFGLTSITPTNAVPPEIAAVADSGGGFKLKPTHAEMPPVYSAFTKATEFDEGKRSCPAPGCSQSKLPKANVGHYVITAGGAAKLQEGEMEHCKDYRTAFDLTLGLYASVINNLAARERVYSSERQAIDEATRAVGVPPSQMVNKFADMCKLSLKRDDYRWHVPNFPPNKSHVKDDDSVGCQVIETIDEASMPNVGNHPFEELVAASQAAKQVGKP